MAGDGGKGGLDDPQKQLYPLRGAEKGPGVRSGCHSTKEPECGPGVMLDGGHCERRLVLLVCEKREQQVTLQSQY